MEDATLLGPRSINKHVFFSEEKSINHNVNNKIAKQLIDMAKNHDCDAVKFQKNLLDIVYSLEMLNSPQECPSETTPRPQKKVLEFSYGEYAEIDHYWN